MFTAQKSAAFFLLIAAEFIAAATFGIQVTEPAGAAHGFPGLYEISGRKLANGEFRQWMEDNRLHIIITYELDNDRRFEEKAVFRQQSELTQERWSWKESKHRNVTREFRADFTAKKATAVTRENNQLKQVSENIEVEPGRTFAGIGFAIAVSNLRKRLLSGEQVELKAVGFSPFPTLKPQVVTVKISHGGLQHMRMGGRSVKGDQFIIHPEIPLIAKLFVNVPDTKVWLTNPTPAGFLRWEGPIVLPNDPLIRVDLLSGTKSEPAQPARG
jgi:hypothetical protein